MNRSTNAVWAHPNYSRGAVDQAGRLLAADNAPSHHQMSHALDIINNWRSLHSFPLNTFQMNLRNKSSKVSNEWLVAQRLKRVPSICQKLQRFPQMKLSRMQDIGGARAVLPNTDIVDSLHNAYVKSRIRHQLSGSKDYIREPKQSGYRSLHLIYRYHSARNETYNGLQIELQFRTRVQHAWATAVETVGTFLRQSLKSSEGHEEWLRFFQLIGSGFALTENTPIAQNVPNDRKDLISAIRKYAHQLQAKKKLEAFGNALQVIDQNPAIQKHKYFLLSLRPAEDSLTIWSYASNQLGIATEQYLEEEKSIALTTGETVLVAVDSLDSLRRAFPNYFLDTQVFIREMSRLLS